MKVRFASRFPYASVCDAAVDIGVLGFVDRDAGVAVGDELLGDRNGDCPARASGLAVAAATAGEIGVLDALLVRREVELQPGPARSAEERSLEAVVVGALPCSSLLRGVEDRLDPLPGGQVDQRFVVAGVVDAFVGDEELVRKSSGLSLSGLESRVPVTALMTSAPPER
ncbi:hypothetical protein QT381_03225 [Galbitalea sp. SE-J8]|nr:hypothetical protein [Galbitalea sp. SE-J8]MDM4762014.1 hypothetical protein [Galbitalea sp. SE-J8]